MAQPVKRHIKEKYNEMFVKDIYTLLIDGHNLLKMSMSDTKLNGNGIHVGGIFQFLLQTKLMLTKKDFDYVYVFWDGDNSGQLRYNIYNDYKANRDKNYAESEYDKYINDYVKRSIQYSKRKRGEIVDIEKEMRKEKEREVFEREKMQIQLMLEELFIRQLDVNEIEGDDLIAYYVNNKQEHEKIVIMSGDKDLSQLLSNDVCIYSLTLKKFITYETHKELVGYHPDNILLKKIICGDASDNIKGIKGVGEDTLFKLFPQMKERKTSLDEILEGSKLMVDERSKNKKKPLKSTLNIINKVTDGIQGENIYDINRKIIDLRNPLLTNEAIKELKAISYTPIDPNERSFKNLFNLIIENDIIDLKDSNRFSNFFSIFNRLIEKESKRYQESYTFG